MNIVFFNNITLFFNILVAIKSPKMSTEEVPAIQSISVNMVDGKELSKEILGMDLL